MKLDVLKKNGLSHLNSTEDSGFLLNDGWSSFFVVFSYFSFILHPDLSFPSLLSSCPPPPLALVASPLFLFRERQASHGC